MIVLRVDPRAPGSVFGEVKAVVDARPGDERVSLLVGRRRVTFGRRCDGSEETLAMLGEFGEVARDD